MEGKIIPYLNRIEWESLHESINFIGLGVDNLPRFFPKSVDNSNIENINISRDENYRIQCKINFKDIKSEEFNDLLDCIHNPKLSKCHWNMNFFDYPKQQLLLENCKGKGIIGSMLNSNFLMSADSMRRLFSMNPVDWITEWYINAPNLLYPRKTSRTLDYTYKRSRDDLGNGNPKFNKRSLVENSLKSVIKTQEKNITSLDYMFIEFEDKNGDDMSFIIHSVPDLYYPKWSRKIGIDYRPEWNIPNNSEREKITEIVSFIFGHQLIKIGETKFDANSKPIEELLISPNIDPEINLKNLSKNPSIDPIKHIYNSTYPSKDSIETLLNQLIPSYINKRDKLYLDEVLRRYWLSQSLPSYARMVILAGGLELLSGCWHKSPESKSKGELLPKETFEIFTDDIKSFKDKLDKLKSGNENNNDFDKIILRVYQKIGDLNKMGTKAGIINFLQEIKLNIGNEEIKAIDCRNEPAHGNILNSNNFKKLKKYEEAYRTLINRVILKVLGYDGDYIDYYSENKVTRHIGEPISDK
jgi:hypothetical protein